MRAANLALRLLVELACLAGLGWAGWELGGQGPTRLVLAVGAPSLFVVVWGLFVSPKAPRRIADPARLALEIGLFTAVALMLAATGAAALAIAFAVPAAIHLVLMVRWGQRGL